MLKTQLETDELETEKQGKATKKTSKAIEEDAKKSGAAAVKNILENYKGLESSYASQLSLGYSKHCLTSGTFRETVWRDLLEGIIPHKFCIEQSVFIIDSKGNVSQEIDLAIFDEMYTPYIFNYGKIKFLPIESVAAVIQCKGKKRDNLKEWAERISLLRTEANSYCRIVNRITDTSEKEIKEASKTSQMTQTSTRPLRMLCCSDKLSDKNLKDYGKLFDIILYVNAKKEIKKYISKVDETFDFWCKELENYDVKNEFIENHAKTNRKLSDLEVEDNVILSLTLQLNQLLMIINNPIPFPHQSYAELFRGERWYDDTK